MGTSWGEWIRRNCQTVARDTSDTKLPSATDVNKRASSPPPQQGSYVVRYSQRILWWFCLGAATDVHTTTWIRWRHYPPLGRSEHFQCVKYKWMITLPLITIFWSHGIYLVCRLVNVSLSSGRLCKSNNKPLCGPSDSSDTILVTIHS